MAYEIRKIEKAKEIVSQLCMVNILHSMHSLKASVG